jgi:hypothetical protein
MRDLLGHYTNQQLLFMYHQKSLEAQQEETWRKTQLEEDADVIFEELRGRGFFFTDDVVTVLNAFQRENEDYV